jgi:hypothetical protein
LVRGVRYAVGLLHVASGIGRTIATTRQAQRLQQIRNALFVFWNRARTLARRRVLTEREVFAFAFADRVFLLGSVGILVVVAAVAGVRLSMS